MSLTLVLQSRSVLLDKKNFLPRESGYKRYLVDASGNEYDGNVSYSIMGTPAIMGSYVAPKYKWEINSFISEKTFEAIKGLWALQNKLERDKSLNFAATLGDEYEYLIDNSTRKRQAVAGIEIKTTDAGDPKYFGVFKVRLSEPKCRRSGSSSLPFMLELIMMETEQTSP